MNKRKLQKRWLCNCIPTVFALLMSGMYSVVDGTQPLMSYYYGSEKYEELLNIKNMAETLAAAPFLLFILPLFLGLNGIWCSLPLGQLFMLMIFYMFFTERKTKI